ncbi:MAG: DUF4397 domain-containing protein, partial [Deltaproteobacteria bacterium]|nr:DUF4397 domain-containing protein [Deltaproteobacteria bacterium]MBW2536390.1 DUF4397 domain-containing protein [Deltaproteobacteria bacterium]
MERISKSFSSAGLMTIAALVGLSLGLFGCSEEEDTPGSRYGGSDADSDADMDGDVDGDADWEGIVPGEAWVRVAHLSPDAPAVDIWTGGEVVIEGLEFGQSSAYLAVPEGTYSFHVTPTGTSDVVLSLEDIALDAESRYTAVAFG